MVTYKQYLESLCLVDLKIVGIIKKYEQRKHLDFSDIDLDVQSVISSETNRTDLCIDTFLLTQSIYNGDFSELDY